MIQNTFPRTQGTLSRESYLNLLLLALIRQAGGELHIGAPALEGIDEGAILLSEWEAKSQRLILRIASPHTVIVPLKGTGWTTQPSQLQPSQVQPSNHRVMSEEEILNRLAEKMRRDMMRQWREQGAAAVAGMPEAANE